MGNDKQLLSFKRLNLAGLAFDRAAALAEHMIQMPSEPAGLLYSPMMSGIVVTYMRPFMRAHGLGSLPSDFSRFTETDLEETHNQIQESRNKLYAHTDIIAAQSITPTDGTTPFEMSIQFGEQNCYTLMPGVPEISPDTLPKIVLLCRFQRNRVTTEINKLWPVLTGGKIYPPGRHSVGATFP